MKDNSSAFSSRAVPPPQPPRLQQQQRAPLPPRLQQQQRAPPSQLLQQPRRAAQFLDFLLASGTFDEQALAGLRVTDIADGYVCCRLLVEQRHQNRFGTLHGGCTATLVDVVGTAALLTRTSRSGVSLAIQTLYHEPMPGGQEVEVEATVVRLGRDVATADVRLRRVADGVLVASGSHVKKLVASSDMTPLFEALDAQQQQQKQQQQQQQGGDAAAGDGRGRQPQTEQQQQAAGESAGRGRQHEHSWPPPRSRL